MKRFLLGLGAMVLMLDLGTAHAFVLADKSAAQKFRKDVNKQLTLYTLCIVKAAQTCEKKGLNTGVECHIDTGVVDGAIDPKAKFPAALAKCAAKVLLAKKSPSLGADPTGDYESIGCPGDANSGTSGDQRFTDLDAYQAGSLANSRAQISLLAAAIDAFGCAAGTAHTDATDMACVADNAAKLGAYAKGVFKCGDKCENDYKGTKGGGGPTDAGNCKSGGDPIFVTCANAALAKATANGPFDSGIQSTVLPLVQSALEMAGDEAYNDPDDCGP